MIFQRPPHEQGSMLPHHPRQNFNAPSPYYGHSHMDHGDPNPYYHMHQSTIPPPPMQSGRYAQRESREMGAQYSHHLAYPFAPAPPAYHNEGDIARSSPHDRYERQHAERSHPYNYDPQMFSHNGPMKRESMHGALPVPGHFHDSRSHAEPMPSMAPYTMAGAPQRPSVIDSMMQMGSPGDQRPTYIGYIKSAHDAILLLSACDLTVEPDQRSNGNRPSQNLLRPCRVTRRLLDAERSDMVASGCVFAWDEKEAGMKRWTDGRVWSASRVSGCFLTYRELEARKKSNAAMHDGPTSNQYKAEGLIKQSFSVTTASNRKLHVISYFTKRDVREGRLRRVSEDPRFLSGGDLHLTVDENEYSLSQQQPKLGQDNDDASLDDEDEEEEEQSGSSSRSSAKLVDSAPQTSVGTSSPPLDPALFQNSLKRGSGSEDGDSDDRHRKVRPHEQRPPARPVLTRLRSSSLSGLPSSGGHTSSASSSKSSSYSSTSSSVATSVPSSGYTSDSKPSLNAQQSSSIRALISPTLPRESAVRNSACEMQPTHSQDSANAVGALLSLATHRSSKAPGPSPLTGNSASDVGAVNGLGLTVAARAGAPDRRESDRNALNMFSVRL